MEPPSTSSFKQNLEPDDWGAEFPMEDDLEVLSPGCSGPVLGVSAQADLATQRSVIAGTDTDMVTDLYSVQFPALGEGEHSVPGHKKRRLSPSVSLTESNCDPSFVPTYGGFRDPDFYSESAYTPKIGESRDTGTVVDHSVLADVQDSGQVQKSAGIEAGHAPATTVIIVEPLPASDGSSNFFTNDVKLARGIQNSLFGPHVLDTRRNFAKKLLVVTLTRVDDVTLGRLLKVDSLGDWPVVCRLPRIFQRTRGVIGPIGLDSDMSDILSALVLSDSSVSEVIRLTKGKEKTPTLSVVVTFTGLVLPSRIKLFYQSFPVRAYIDRPWQCFRCQNFGHNADQCRYRVRCVVCAGPHLVKDCASRSSGGSSVGPVADTANRTVQCANCRGAHTANYGGCKFMQKAKKVEKLRVQHRLSYREAVLKVNQEERILHVTTGSAVSETLPLKPSSGRQRAVLLQPSQQTVQVGISTSTQTDTVLDKSHSQEGLVQMVISLMVRILERTKLISRSECSEISSYVHETVGVVLGLGGVSDKADIVTSQSPLVVQGKQQSDPLGLDGSGKSSPSQCQVDQSSCSKRPPFVVEPSHTKGSRHLTASVPVSVDKSSATSFLQSPAYDSHSHGAILPHNSVPAPARVKKRHASHKKWNK